ncbi:MAG TPA: hypothetical protein VFP61_04530 [Acidimicrobiales bacterium]|nr:hypothetical protein [Acidimicrobiales bacterium]
MAGAYLHWGWGSPMAGRVWQVKVRTEAPPGVGQYLALDNGTIDGAGWYLGVQTDLFRPGVGGVGPGVIFSSWATRSGDDLEVAAGGYAEVGDHEGGFVGVRLPVRLRPGRWRFALWRAGAVPTSAGGGDRFRLTVTPPDGRAVDAGAIAFPRASPSRPATIGSGGTGFWELYAGAVTPDVVPRWEVAVMAHDPGSGARCPSGAVSYPRFPDRPPFEAVDAWFDRRSGMVEVRAGAGVRTDHPARRWP